MTTKEKYELIDKTKINEKVLAILQNMEKSSRNFTDEAVNSKIDGALDKLIEGFRANKPEALRTLPEAKKEVKKEKEKATKENEGKDLSDKKDTDDKTGLPKKDTLEERKDIIKKQSESEKEARDRARKELEKEKDKAKDEVESQIEKLNRLILEDPSLRGFNTGTAATGGGRSTPIIDAERKALPRGSRVSQKGWKNQYGASDGGRKYWENRENRSDRKSPEYETGKPYLAKGGNVYSSDELYIVKVYDGKTNELVDMSKRVWARNLQKAKEEAIYNYEDDMKQKYGDDLRFRVEEAPSMFADGGFMADGGKVDKRILEKVYENYDIYKDGTNREHYDDFDNIEKVKEHIEKRTGMEVLKIKEIEIGRNYPDNMSHPYYHDDYEFELVKGQPLRVERMYGRPNYSGNVAYTNVIEVKNLWQMADGGETDAELYIAYENTFKRFDSDVPVPMEDFEKLLHAYQKQLSGDKLDVVKYEILKGQMGNYLGHKTVEEMEAYFIQRGNSYKMANGGEVEGVDLFEDYDDQPEEVQAILANYEMEDNDYETLQNLKAELESIGYTMEFGLDAEPYDLRKIGEKGKSEFYAKGGKLNTEVVLTENRSNGAKWRGVVKPFMMKSIEQNQYGGGFKRYEIDIYDDKVEREPSKEELKEANEFFDKVGGRFADGGMMADGGKVDLNEKMAKMRSAYDNLEMQVKGKIASAIGIDEAIRIMENDYEIHPFDFIIRAVRSGLLALDEINRDLVFSALIEAENITEEYRDSGQGIGSSDMTYFTKDVLDYAGFKTGFLNNRLTRVDADGNELVIDKYEMNY
jgi:hypothetical protein